MYCSGTSRRRRVENSIKSILNKYSLTPGLHWEIKLLNISDILMLCSCGSARHYAAFQYDNGDDYVSEGLYRIVDRKGRIGYADETGKTVIRPRFAFGYPFEGGKAKVTDSGERKEVAGSGSEHWYWESDDWYYIDKQGNRCENQDTDKDKTHP